MVKMEATQYRKTNPPTPVALQKNTGLLGKISMYSRRMARRNEAVAVAQNHSEAQKVYQHQHVALRRHIGPTFKALISCSG
jgi:hypothetical protein